MDEAQHDDDAGESAFERHLGALYSCSTRTTMHSLSDRQELPTDSASSARCLLIASGEPTLSIHNSANGYLAVEEKAGSSTTIREVFCRALPLQNSANARSSTGSPNETIPNPNATTVGNGNGLRKALGTLYGGLHIISSPQSSVAGPKWQSNSEGEDRGGNAEQTENAAQPQLPLETRLATCSRLHAGLVPLYTPLVESEDGVFLVSRSPPSGLVWCTSVVARYHCSFAFVNYILAVACVQHESYEYSTVVAVVGARWYRHDTESTYEHAPGGPKVRSIHLRK